MQPGGTRVLNTCNTRNNAPRPGERGAALVMALGFLTIMAMMGAYYVRYMNIEARSAELDLARLRAAYAAESGAHAALAALARAHAAGQVQLEGGRETAYEFPVYRRLSDSGPRGFSADPRRRASAVVRVSDENAKINLNTAPAGVIAAILGVDDDTAGAIVAAQPRGGEVKSATMRPTAPSGREQDWLYTLDDLKRLGLLDEAQYHRLNPAWVTTFSALPMGEPAHTLNVNAADAEVMAAALGVPIEKAGEIVAYRREKPFRTPLALQLAAGKRMADFPMSPPESPHEVFAMESRCFHVVSEGAYESAGTGRATARVEAVAHFGDGGDYEIIYWNAARARGQS